MSKRVKKKKSKPQADQATPETRRKLKRGTLAYMIENGDISATGPEMMASDEIACAYSYQAHGQTTRVQSYERQDRSFNQNEPAWTDYVLPRYKKWATRAPKLCFDITIAVCWDQKTARELDKAYKWQSGTAKKILLWSLRHYAVLSGFVGAETSAQWLEIIENGDN